jgi:hypothetical protein
LEEYYLYDVMGEMIAINYIASSRWTYFVSEIDREAKITPQSRQDSPKNREGIYSYGAFDDIYNYFGK